MKIIDDQAIQVRLPSQIADTITGVVDKSAVVSSGKHYKDV
jgi:hypothetical protein